MYIFEARYYNMLINEEYKRVIEFNGQDFDNEKECYIYAMERAFDLLKENETLTFVEFIAC